MRLEAGHHQAQARIPDAAAPYVGLWCEVLRVAVEDARGDVRHNRPELRRLIQQQANSWFTSDESGPGSFLWICALLELDPDSVRANLESPP